MHCPACSKRAIAFYPWARISRFFSCPCTHCGAVLKTPRKVIAALAAAIVPTAIGIFFLENALPPSAPLVNLIGTRGITLLVAIVWMYALFFVAWYFTKGQLDAKAEVKSGK
ncbi:MAG: hypothetical protein KIS92_10315 [Planctomycetota bacterium]|nr:hypothetical protein [Planctomycetota bacterium]